MAGVLLENVDLLHEGFGQVMLGGPGPVLACRIGPRRIRLFLDIPGGKSKKDAATLWNLFQGVLPQAWRDSFRAALPEHAATRASNPCRSPSHYRRRGAALDGHAGALSPALSAKSLLLTVLCS